MSLTIKIQNHEKTQNNSLTWTFGTSRPRCLYPAEAYKTCARSDKDHPGLRTNFNLSLSPGVKYVDGDKPEQIPRTAKRTNKPEKKSLVYVLGSLVF